MKISTARRRQDRGIPCAGPPRPVEGSAGPQAGRRSGAGDNAPPTNLGLPEGQVFFAVKTKADQFHRTVDAVDISRSSTGFADRATRLALLDVGFRT